MSERSVAQYTQPAFQARVMDDPWCLNYMVAHQS